MTTVGSEASSLDSAVPCKDASGIGVEKTKETDDAATLSIYHQIIPVPLLAGESGN